MASKKTKRIITRATFTRKPADPIGLYPAARVRLELTLSGAFQIPPTKPVKTVAKKAGKKHQKKGKSVITENKSSVEEGISLKAIGSLEELAVKEEIRLNQERLKLAQVFKEPTSRRFDNLEVSCPVMLVHQDEDVLVALLAIAASSGRRQSHKLTSDHRKCLDEKNPADLAISVDVLRSELVDLLNWGRNGKTYDAVFHSLVRLSKTRLEWKENYKTNDGDVIERESNLIGFIDCPWNLADEKSLWVPWWDIGTHDPKAKSLENCALDNSAPDHQPETEHEEPIMPHPENSNQIQQTNKKKNKGRKPKTGKPAWIVSRKPFTVVISPYLSEPVLKAETKEKFGLHWTAERSKLGPSARCLYSQLAAIVWPGKTIKTSWNNLVKRLFTNVINVRNQGTTKPKARDRGTTALNDKARGISTPNDRDRGIATRLLKSMPPGWSFVMEGTGARSTLQVTRPAIKTPKFIKINN